MTARYESKAVNQPSVPMRVTARSLLLVSSGVVRKCEKAGVTTRISKWVTLLGLSATTRT